MSIKKLKPRGKPFAKGAKDPRINRAGTPKVAAEFQVALREAFVGELDKPYPKNPECQTNFERIISLVMLKATEGDAWAIEMIFHRVGGNVIQHEVTGVNGGPMIWDIPRPERERKEN